MFSIIDFNLKLRPHFDLFNRRTFIKVEIIFYKCSTYISTNWSAKLLLQFNKFFKNPTSISTNHQLNSSYSSANTSKLDQYFNQLINKTPPTVQLIVQKHNKQFHQLSTEPLPQLIKLHFKLSHQFYQSSVKLLLLPQRLL